MSDYGLSVFHDGKSLNLSHASPLTFIDMIEMKKKNEVLGQKWNFYKANSASVDYSDRCPPGSQLLCLCERQFWLIKTPSLWPIRFYIDIQDRTVRLSNEVISKGDLLLDKPGNIYVFAIYPTVSSFDGYGLGIYGAGAFPLVVDPSKGMFMTYKADITFTGNMKIPVSRNSLVFFHCDAVDVGVEYNPDTQQLSGYRYEGGGVSQAIAVRMKIVAFDIKAPTMSDYGIAIYGHDGKVVFTSNEVPMLVRGFVNTPPEHNATIGLPNWHQGPMTPAFTWGIWHKERRGYKANAGMSSGGITGGPGPFLHDVGKFTPDGTTIIYANKPLPVLWASDYF